MGIKHTFTTENFDEILTDCYTLWENSSKGSVNIYGKLYDILYSSEEEYVHKYPRTLYLQLTSNCNLRCKHCFFNDKPEKYDTKNNLSDSEIFRLLKYFVEEVSILRCVITGGEIFTSPILYKVVKYLKKHAIVVRLITNGTLITDDVAKKYAKLLNPKYDSIQVSLDGSTTEINDNIRGEGVYNKVISAIQSLIKYNCNVEIGFTINSQNVTDIVGIYRLAQRLNVKNINIGKFTLQHDGQLYLQPSIEDILVNIAQLYHIYKHDIKLKLDCLKVPDFVQYPVGRILLNQKLNKKIIETNDRVDVHCHKHHEQVTLFADGNVSLCYDCTINDTIIGNVKTDTFEKIWENRYNFPIFQKRYLCNHECRKCKYVSVCLVGCPYQALKKHGTINAPGYDCAYLASLGE